MFPLYNNNNNNNNVQKWQNTTTTTKIIIITIEQQIMNEWVNEKQNKTKQNKNLVTPE